jgi:hypothetical protein
MYLNVRLVVVNGIIIKNLLGLTMSIRQNVRIAKLKPLPYWSRYMTRKLLSYFLPGYKIPITDVTKKISNGKEVSKMLFWIGLVALILFLAIGCQMSLGAIMLWVCVYVIIGTIIDIAKWNRGE